MDRFRVGTVAVHRIEEWQGSFAAPREMFRGYDDARWALREPEFVPDFYRPADGKFYGFLQSWLLDTGRERILFDTGAGNDKDRPGIPIFAHLATDFLDRLAATGFAPEDVDVVVCSHLHIDHVGWNTRLRDGKWVPTFPNARYVLPVRDRDVWDPAVAEIAPSALGAHVNAGVFEDSVRPLMEIGRAEWVDDGFEVVPGLSLHARPGHTPGQMMMRLDSDGQRALFIGDVAHHPVQIHEPDWNSQFCEDPDQARASRRQVLEEAAATGALLVPAHFGGAHVVRVAREGSGFRPVYDTGL
jgi:glyoxylase-like metal-dependent hydrolase (beta-lactamase superfamily II)